MSETLFRNKDVARDGTKLHDQDIVGYDGLGHPRVLVPVREPVYREPDCLHSFVASLDGSLPPCRRCGARLRIVVEIGDTDE